MMFQVTTRDGLNVRARAVELTSDKDGHPILVVTNVHGDEAEVAARAIAGISLVGVSHEPRPGRVRIGFGEQA